MKVIQTRARAAEKKAVKSKRAALRGGMSETEKKMEKNVTKIIIATILQKEDEVRSHGHVRLPKNYIKEIVEKYKPALPLLTVKSLHNALMYERNKKRNKRDEQSPPRTTGKSESSTTTPSTNNHDIGRPKGSTIISKHENDLKVAACYNEVTLEVAKVRGNGIIMTQTNFDDIVSIVKKKLDLPDEIVVKRNTVDKRIARKHLIVDSYKTKGGPESPLSELEPTFVEILLMMSKIKAPLTPPQMKDFINSAINGSEHQEKLIAYKKKLKCQQSEEKLGKVSSRYISGFLKRWGHLISSKKARRFELDRGQWAKYSNFDNMYDSIEKTLVASGVAKALEHPLWMNKEGQVVDKKEHAYGRKCTIEITHPDLCIVMDEVGSNTSQKGDGHIGGKKYICETGYVPQLKASKRDKHFTLLGLTTFAGTPLMCVVIIQGKNRIPQVETGIDTSVEDYIGSYDDIDFMKNNKGPGKRFPGGPTCTFRGKDIPCLVRFSESGGMTGDILLTIFKTLDHFELFKEDRQNERVPFVLLDGHDTRFYVPFVKYINDPKSKFSVSLGVPYGTSYWQVGDSSEQNGSYKMEITNAKDSILAQRESTMISDLGIMSTDIMVLVNQAWKRSFARVSENKKAVAERGWFPYNRILLDHPDLRATMTADECEDEKFLSSESDDSQDISELTLDNMLQDTHYYSRSRSKPQFLNLNGGMGQHILTHIVREVDLQKARERIENEKKEGIRVKTMLKDLKKITAAGIVRCGEYTIGKSVEDELIDRANKKKQAEDEKRQRQEEQQRNQILKQQHDEERKRAREHLQFARAEKKRCLFEEKEKKREAQYIKRYNKAVDLIETKGRRTWTVTDYKVVLMALKTKDDGQLPNTLEDLSLCYDSWIERNMTLREIMMEQSQVSSAQASSDDSENNGHSKAQSDSSVVELSVGNDGNLGLHTTSGSCDRDSTECSESAAGNSEEQM